tara:strand:+ start:431 stop:625 length:195 start_codon:yes stop_codon:yes gene_type:complete
MTNSTEEYWVDQHSKRKKQIISQLEKYIKVRNVSKIDIVNMRFDHEIKRLREELNTVNQLLDVI